jgi:hypothetical protein
VSHDDERSPDALPAEAQEWTALASRHLGRMTREQHARGLDSLRARMAARRRQRRWRIATLAITGATAIAVGVPWAVLHHPTTRPLAYKVDGAALGAAGEIEARGGEHTALRFEDGTVVALDAGTVGRLRAVDGEGAHISLERGRARVSVVPKRHAHWLLDVGPFQIAVHGTVFTAGWDAARKRLDVSLERGSISVSGPLTEGPIAMRAGQRLTISADAARVVLRPIERDEGAEDEVASEGENSAAPGEPPEAPSAARAVETPRPSSAPRAAHAGRGWAAALAAGDFDGILADAAVDLPRALRTRSSDELAALADAARYRRREDVARRALHAERRRFPHSARAADAAFFLGRLDESAGGGAPAVRWYDRYLREAPAGPFADEALGRKMIVTRDLDGPDASRALAGEYLGRFPHGSYAGAARALRDR